MAMICVCKHTGYSAELLLVKSGVARQSQLWAGLIESPYWLVELLQNLKLCMVKEDRFPFEFVHLKNSLYS